MNLTEKYNIKANQFYTALRSRNSMTMDEAYECLKTTSAGHDRDGMTSDAIKFFVKYGLAHRSKNRLHFIDVKNSKKAIAELALEMAEHTSMYLSNRKIKKMQSKPQDIVQPTLFTESVMREQEQPIVTANDQLNHRVNVLESKLNNIINYFKTL
jgi:hypothetical protein